jgi:Ca2+-binding RTX toxin-like protein
METEMVKFVGYKSVDNTDLTEIGLFKNIKKNLDRKGEGKSFDATKGDIDMHVTGKAMLFVLKNPVSGKMKTVDVKVDGSEKYYLSGLDIKLNKMKSFFKGNYEKSIFSGDDKITGSSQSDKLAGFNGKDTINAGSGGDNVGGGKGNDKLYGEGGSDVLSGDAGKDFLDGGVGNNVLSGGKDSDTFQFSSQLSAGNTSSITDFEIGKDKIQLVKSVFPDLTGSGTLSADKFVKLADYTGQDNVVVYDKATGQLSYALDSNNLFNFGGVQSGLNLKASDIILA